MIIYFKKEAPEWLKQHVAKQEAVGNQIDMADILNMAGSNVPREAIDHWMSSLGYMPAEHVKSQATRYGQPPTPPDWFLDLAQRLATDGKRMTAQQVAIHAGREIDTRAIGGWLRAMGHGPRKINGRTVFFG